MIFSKHLKLLLETYNSHMNNLGGRYNHTNFEDTHNAYDNFNHSQYSSLALEENHSYESSDSHGHHSSFGVHIVFEDLYDSILFFAFIYCFGKISSQVFKMPSLVGEIISGVILGPGLLDLVPNPSAFVMLGEIGLILLVIEAGIDIDLKTIKLIGARGVSIAIVGSILPIILGMCVAFALGVDVKGSIAAGCCFGPTSLGIAMNILRSSKIIDTPVGQMIVAAAIIDDMFALIILSQLGALAGTVTVAGIVTPIISALAFLIVGGYLAISVFPPYFERKFLSKIPHSRRGPCCLAALFLFVIILMPATYYAKASYLMGSFVAGLAFCSNHDAHVHFASQFKRVLQWLMRIFFAASIGFQVPVQNFANGKVIFQGLFFVLAILGKIAVGFMVPNFTTHPRFSGLHLRDCLAVSFSMAAEGEFAFVIAVFAVDSQIISKDIYASIVLAILLSTIIAPFSLRMILQRKSHATQTDSNDVEQHQRRLSIIELDDVENSRSEVLTSENVFIKIKIHCENRWGLLHDIMKAVGELKLDVIDHRTWSPHYDGNGSTSNTTTTLVNEIYVKDCDLHDNESLQERLFRIQDHLQKDVIRQPNNAIIKVQQWTPLAMENLREEIAKEAALLMEMSRERQMNATKERSITDLLDENRLQKDLFDTANVIKENREFTYINRKRSFT